MTRGLLLFGLGSLCDVCHEGSRLVIRRLLVRFPVEASLSKTLNPLIAPDVQCAISVNVKKMCIHCKSHICKSLWIKASAKCKCTRTHSSLPLLHVFLLGFYRQPVWLGIPSSPKQSAPILDTLKHLAC